ncbi:MAG: TVP38/TMEM64 family protein [Spartobacteria bacterium]|nr:TVP38/TMEM64 family protein [Spartobacteria bacterium]
MRFAKYLKHINRETLRKCVVRMALVAVGLGLVALLGRFFGHYVPQAEAWINDQGVWGPLIYVLVYCLLVASFFSVDVLSFAAGVMFGLWRGFLYAYFGTFVAGALIFFVGRHLARGRVEKFVKSHPNLAKVDTAVGKEGLKIMLLLRMSPLPFAPLSYSLSITRVSFSAYLAACAGMALTNFISVYYGYVAKHLTGVAGGVEHHGAGHYILMFGMLAVTILAAVVVTRVTRQALK